MKKNIVIYHSGDYDGIFCREIARKFLPEEGTQFIGWNFGDPPIRPGSFVEATVYIMDLPTKEPFGWPMPMIAIPDGELIWIDHHATSLATHPPDIPGYRIDGVAACRLAWQWFSHQCKDSPTHCHPGLPILRDFIDRKVEEPLAILLAGEYDVWDSRPCDIPLIGR